MTDNPSPWQRFHSFPWDTDEQWNQYLNNLTIPENISATQREGIINKYKRKYFSQKFVALPEFKSVYDLVQVKPKTKHTATLIYLHGLGDSGEGWGSTFEEVSRTQFPYLKVVLPSALARPVTLNYGMTMPAWYDLKGLSESSEEDTKGFQETMNNLREIIKNEMEEHNIPSNRIMIGGFSQGGSCALYLGLTYEKKLAGVLGMSTFLLQRESFRELLLSSSQNTETPVLMCHGTADQVVRFEWGQKTYNGIKDLLREKLGREPEHVQFKSYSGMGHSGSPQELRDVAQFIKQCLPQI
jgi:predicted esterase